MASRDASSVTALVQVEGWLHRGLGLGLGLGVVQVGDCRYLTNLVSAGAFVFTISFFSMSH